MSNVTAQPLHGHRLARFSKPLSDGSRDVLIPIHAPASFTDSEAQDLADELNRLKLLTRSMDFLDVIRSINEALRRDEDPEHSSLTAAEIAALRAAGSFVGPEDALPIQDRPSVHTALRQESILADSLTTDQVAQLLDVSASRVRQRHGERSLFTMPAAGRALRFPRFQFTDRGELPGWGAVCEALPEHANPVAVEHFLTHTHPDLAGGELTPAQWLAAGNPAAPVAALAEQVFAIR